MGDWANGLEEGALEKGILDDPIDNNNYKISYDYLNFASAIRKTNTDEEVQKLCNKYGYSLMKAIEIMRSGLRAADETIAYFENKEIPNSPF